MAFRMARLPRAFFWMLNVLWSCGVHGAASTAPATAPTTAATQDSARIESLIPQLSAASWQTRQDAQDALVQMGDNAKARLERLLNETKDPEVRTRAEAAIQLIDENRLTGPSIITLDFNNAKPQAVIAELGRQAFTTINVSPESLWTQGEWPLVTVHVDHQPFWIALRQVCKQIGVRPQNIGADRGLALGQAAANDPFDAPCSYAGPFMVIANSASQTNSLVFAQPNNANRSLSIQFMVYAEPKLQVVVHSYMASLQEAIDDRGRSFVSPTQFGESSSSDSTPIWPISAVLNQPRDPGTKIARMRGYTRVVLQTQSQTWEIGDIASARPQVKNINGRVFSFREFKQSSETATVRLTSSAPARQPGEALDGYASTGGVQLLDGAGKALGRRGSSTNGDGARMEYTFTFDRSGPDGQTGEPAKLVWKLPLETKEHRIPFEFTDLPLP